MERRVSTFISTKLVNPPVKAAARAGIPLPGIVILETTGRRSGLPRRTPVGKAITDGALWVIAEHGRSASYVRNIEADARVRVKIGRRWRTGSAQILDQDDVRARQRRIPNKPNSAIVRLMGSDPVTVRIELDG